MYIWEQNAVAVVTGAGVGLGRALSVEFTRRGIAVAGLGRNLDDLRTTAAMAEGAPFSPMAVDVSDSRAVADAFSEIRSKVGAPTILVNNAAIHPRRDFIDEGPEDFMACVSINLGGAVNATHAALRTMIQLGHGRIVNVGSFADLAPQPCAGAYSVSKGALRTFSRALVADLADRFPNIIVTTWMPGILATRMGLPVGLDPAVAARWGVELALCNDRGINGATFERDCQMAQARSLKRRIVERILRRQAPLMRLA
ncbi:SDR family oxidoreductase [Mesorhizobium sp. AR10]|uniref:SDR family NAD(P)-dependent oxidoreductase n=1 Tax=Mesorhizobium sp. AR10 TaxID=2865839 RepID=UPI00215E32F2|nr:SDR family oxidoreductase [Mesorhizobium sp. AR10]UVK40228.1 SDR family oxidoreductase [Mesorhizobium sp. AR10]